MNFNKLNSKVLNRGVLRFVRMSALENIYDFPENNAKNEYLRNMLWYNELCKPCALSDRMVRCVWAERLERSAQTLMENGRNGSAKSVF